MQEDTTTLQSEVRALRKEVGQLHALLRRHMESTAQQHVESLIETTRSNMIDAVAHHYGQQVDETLERTMVDGCEMKETCKRAFNTLLQRNLEQLGSTAINEDALSDVRKELLKMRSNAPYESCATCFSEATALFERQVELMRSLRIYNDPVRERREVQEIDEGPFVKSVIEPVANKQRLQMLKALANETMTFSALSQLTGLSGGNLLFHINKLVASELVIQRHERGDYMITEKGYRTLAGLSDIAVRIRV
ncbi:ArsR family transcriptional regulator [archaeon]|nr:MAG: ArsR family transcriptional regulator [archaeon]